MGWAPPTRSGIKVLARQSMEKVLVSMVTAPVFDKALLQPIVASVFKAMLVSARMFPSNHAYPVGAQGQDAPRRLRDISRTRALGLPSG